MRNVCLNKSTSETLAPAGGGIDATAMIKSIEKAIVKDPTGVFNKNENLWKSIGITSEDILKELAKNNKLDKFEQLKNVFKTTK